jgi:hypothetical protein
MKTQIFKSYDEFLQREDKSVNGVSDEFAQRHVNYAEQNETNTGCWIVQIAHFAHIAQVTNATDK